MTTTLLSGATPFLTVPAMSPSIAVVRQRGADEALPRRCGRGAACEEFLYMRSRRVPSRHFPKSMVAASMSVSAADRACSRGEVSLSEVARAKAPSKSTASWLPSR